MAAGVMFLVGENRRVAVADLGTATWIALTRLGSPMAFCSSRRTHVILNSITGFIQDENIKPRKRSTGLEARVTLSCHELMLDICEILKAG